MVKASCRKTTRKRRIGAAAPPNQGNPEGQYLLGLMYDKGQGVPASSPRAYIWLNLAAAHVSGNRRDLFYRIRDSVATKMTPDQVTVAQRVAVEWTPTVER